MNNTICLVTWSVSVNFGTCVQAYALAQFIRDQGYNVYIPNTFKYYYGINHPIETILLGFRKIKEKIAKQKDIKKDPKYSTRIHKNTEFAEMMTGLVIIHSKEEYKNYIRNTNIFIAGSDQIWNPNYSSSPFLLGCAPLDKRKISYATNIGVNRIPVILRPYYKRYLNRLDMIGVREATAKKALTSFINKEVHIVLDPTFLLDKEKWRAIAKKPTQISNEEFVFCYFIGNKEQWIQDVDSMLNAGDLEVYYMPTESQQFPSKIKGIFDAGVCEFVWCLLNANLVLTDSFHATALSINFNTNFVVYERFDSNEEKSQNSRIYDLVNQFSLKNHLRRNMKSIEEIKNCKNDFIRSNNSLDNLRIESMDYLINGLK